MLTRLSKKRGSHDDATGTNAVLVVGAEFLIWLVRKARRVSSIYWNLPRDFLTGPMKTDELAALSETVGRIGKSKSRADNRKPQTKAGGAQVLFIPYSNLEKIQPAEFRSSLETLKKMAEPAPLRPVGARGDCFPKNARFQQLDILMEALGRNKSARFFLEGAELSDPFRVSLRNFLLSFLDCRRDELCRSASAILETLTPSLARENYARHVAHIARSPVPAGTLEPTLTSDHAACQFQQLDHESASVRGLVGTIPLAYHDRISRRRDRLVILHSVNAERNISELLATDNPLIQAAALAVSSDIEPEAVQAAALKLRQITSTQCELLLSTLEHLSRTGNFQFSEAPNDSLNVPTACHASQIANLINLHPILRLAILVRNENFRNLKHNTLSAIALRSRAVAAERGHQPRPEFGNGSYFLIWAGKIGLFNPQRGATIGGLSFGAGELLGFSRRGGLVEPSPQVLSDEAILLHIDSRFDIETDAMRVALNA